MIMPIFQMPMIINSDFINKNKVYLYTLAISPSLGDSLQQRKQNNVPLHSSSRVWMALLGDTAHPPRLPQLTLFHICQFPYCPYHRVASIRQPRGNSRCQLELRHNRSPLIFIPSMLTCLLHIHPFIIQGSFYSIHPPKLRPPSSTSPINFPSSRSLSILST